MLLHTLGDSGNKQFCYIIRQITMPIRKQMLIVLYENIAVILKQHSLDCWISAAASQLAL